MSSRPLAAAAVAAVLFVAIQLVPYRVDTPPVEANPAFADPAVESLARRACYDCHSHETVTPWYGRIAPVSWYVTHHVREGREHLNFSRWNVDQHDADEMADAVREGWMPPGYYTRLHPEARLIDAEKATLAAGLEALPAPGR